MKQGSGRQYSSLRNVKLSNDLGQVENEEKQFERTQNLLKNNHLFFIENE